MSIKENDIVEYTSHDGYKVKGRVVSVFINLSGEHCVNINNFATTRLLSEVGMTVIPTLAMEVRA